MRDEFSLIKQALDLLQFLVEDGNDETDKKIAQWGLEALEELKQKKDRDNETYTGRLVRFTRSFAARRAFLFRL